MRRPMNKKDPEVQAGKKAKGLRTTPRGTRASVVLLVYGKGKRRIIRQGQVEAFLKGVTESHVS